MNSIYYCTTIPYGTASGNQRGEMSHSLKTEKNKMHKKKKNCIEHLSQILSTKQCPVLYSVRKHL